ncbi:MAPEG family protein [Acaryochloris marina]|uniref:MAPEG family protein n=1 Tax=Acaryochloris marina (strain MBIC 11017) TaxID=329726 RepID=B0C115_ACAM1|nr:MAPEG family protein [Acaryochloris marina]ABW27274.1 conserved hypothetical protein [Acaryochloris marina MBIC11017]BDM82020.1 membrane protein [Acaryochloris marina MBIC10699]
MNQQAIFAPIFVMFLLTLTVWIYMYAHRIPFIIKNNFPPEKMRPLEFARISPPSVSNPSDNLKNLFELPVLFYALGNYLFMTSQVDGFYVFLAWIFAGFRILHSLVHCTINRILLRFYLYLTAAVALWLMVLRAGWQYLGSA